MALLSLPVALVADEAWGGIGLGLTALLSLTVGQGLVLTTRGTRRFYRYQSMLIAGISWLLIALVGAIPLWVSAHMMAPDSAMQLLRHPAHAFFESVSGFTSTGLTVVDRASALPHHVQWWRSFSQWVGGIGVILLLLAVLPADRGAINLYFSEARDEKILPTVRSTVQTIWALYLGYTLAAVALLWIAGEPLWRAVNHGLTAISTGGFTITDDSLMRAPPAVQLAYVPIMVVGAVSFLVHYRVIVERAALRTLWQRVELRVLIAVLFGGALLLIAQRWLTPGDAALVETLFVWVSAVTSGGFAAADLSIWRDAALLLVLTAVIMGGMAGSTSGGIKLLRVGLLLKDLIGQLRSLRATAHEVVVLRYDGARVTPSEMASLGHTALRLVGVFMLLWLLGVFVMLHWLPADTRLAHVFFDTASALFNSGLSTGVAGSDLGVGGAIILSVLMLLGRLEVFPLLLLAAFLLGRR
jgi:trk system potassium uptake protein TrkH